MSVAIITNMTKYYGADLIFEDVSFRVEQRDRIGLVGPNGAGKTTLLKLLTGSLEPDAGSVSVAQGVRVGYLPQIPDFHPSRTLREELLDAVAHIREMEERIQQVATDLAAAQTAGDAALASALLDEYADVQHRFEHAGGYTIDSRVEQVLSGLGFSRELWDAPARQLSGGQQTRAALGKLLVREPELLLLDEPTNHLDLNALEWLEDYLTAWRGAVLVVSHDRYFLDRVTNRTIEVDHHAAYLYHGAYSQFVRLRTERLERWEREYVTQQEHIAHQEDFIRRYKAGQRAKEARGRQKQLDRLERVDRPPEQQTIRFHLGARYESGQTVLTTDKLVAGFPPRPGEGGDGLRLAVPDIMLVRGERVALMGANGSGKTTLLRTLLGEIPPRWGRASLGHNVHIGYYAQTHEHLDSALTVLDEVRQSTSLSEEGVRTFLGRFLFTEDDVFKPVGALSGGERARVALAKLSLQGANFLVLDEPTNHLDLPSRQALETILSEYDGTILFVSHDRYFVDALATQVWTVADGRLQVHQGNYTRFRQHAQVAAHGAKGSASAKKAVQRGSTGSGAKQATRTAQTVEAEITALESKVSAIEAELAEASAHGDVGRITMLGTDYEHAQELLHTLYDEWAELAS
ncbi:MAG TPA: ABC-F family ATP-binding cassette domain-containing protein [Ktedonobacterales bacterium]